MNCAELEELLADYVDNTLAPDVRQVVEGHVSHCIGCQALLHDITAALAFLGRVGDVEPPPELVTRIAFQAPVGRTRRPFETQGFLSRLATKWLQPILQPKLAMGMAMTILSFAMLERCTGVRVQHIQAADLSPVRIWDGVEDKVFRVKDRAVKYYENIRLVYDVETRLRELDQAQSSASQGSSFRKPGANNGGKAIPKEGDTKK